MNTIFLGSEEVDAYCKDFIARLRKLPEAMPKVFCPIGKSGHGLLCAISKQLTEQEQEELRIVPIIYDKKTGVASFKDIAEISVISEVNAVLVLDSSVHSGNSMLRSLRLIQANGAKRIISYSLVIKQRTRFIPHYFGMIVGDHNRAIFMLDVIPNNRLFAGSNHQPLGIFRYIDADDVNRESQCLDVGVPSIDKITWGDLYYEHRANGYDVIVIEDGENLAGFIKIMVKYEHTLHIDIIANDKGYRGKGIGGALMRYAENIARAQKLKFIELWSISDKIDFYKDKCGFKLLEDTIDAGDGETYNLMRRPLLYHFNLAD